MNLKKDEKITEHNRRIGRMSENPLDNGREQELIDLHERGYIYCEDCGEVHEENKCEED